MTFRVVRSLWGFALGAAVLACAAFLGGAFAREHNGSGPSLAAATSPAATDRMALALAAVRGAGRTEQRVLALERRVRAQPASDDGLILLGQAWVRLARESSDPGYYLHAAACADLVRERSPASAAAANLRGLVLLNQHSFAEAKTAAEAILAREPRDATAWGTLSDAALELGEFDTAASAVTHMLEQKPGLPSYSRAAYLRFLHGDERGAIEGMRLAIDSGDPADPEPLAWVLVQTAALFFLRGDYAGADAGFTQALELEPGYPPALVGRARVLLTAGDPARAAALLEQAFRVSPLVETGALLVQARARAGDRAGAERAYAAAEREGLRGDPRSLSVMDSTLGRHPERALELARKERAARGDVYTDDALAWALYRNGRFELARESIERARRLGTRDARLLFHHGAVLLALGQKAAGRALVREALALSPHFEPDAADEAERLLVGPV